LLECALCKARICKLAECSILASEEEDAVFSVIEDFFGFGNGWEDFRLLVLSPLLFRCRSACASRQASHFDRGVVGYFRDDGEDGQRPIQRTY